MRYPGLSRPSGATQREAIEQRNERLDEFAAVVAHDLRNPLNVASGQVELERMDRDSKHRRRLQQRWTGGNAH
ncbi:hypothetical protein C8039_02470 [Halogeometricum sp. wsp3]|nr:hypothetical protein C8039_02470 [Halogeometricum sp. wsp3]